MNVTHETWSTAPEGTERWEYGVQGPGFRFNVILHGDTEDPEATRELARTALIEAADKLPR